MAVRRKYNPGYEHQATGGIIKYLEKIPDARLHIAKWECYCKIIFKSVVNHVINGTTKSCGCWKKLITKQSIKDPNVQYLKSIYNSIKMRCYNQNNAGYKNYGGRGIIIFLEWKNNKSKFIEDILFHLGHRPTNKHQLDRIDNNGNYEISNLRWLSNTENNRNRRNNRLITINGETKPMSAWAEISNINQNTLAVRIKYNWPEEKLLQPVKIKIEKKFDNTNFKHLHHDIKQRCFNINNKAYKNYGGRGIFIHKMWVNNYQQFQQDILNSIGPRPSSKHQFDRINNNLGYLPNNIRWVTPKENSNNKRNNKLIEINGEIKTMTGWANYSEISIEVIYKRLLYGYTGLDIIKPLLKRKLNDQQIENIQKLTNNGISIGNMCKLYNVSRPTIEDVIHRRGAYVK